MYINDNMNNKKLTVYLPSLTSLSSDDLDLYETIHDAHVDLVRKLKAAGYRVQAIDGSRAHLRSMMKHAAQSDAFIFPPMTSLPESHPKFKAEAIQRWFEFFSLVTGVHVGNKEKYGPDDKAKPCVVIDPDGQWKLATELLDDLKAKGMFSSSVDEIAHVVNGATGTIPASERNERAVSALKSIIESDRRKALASSVPKLYENKIWESFRKPGTRHEFGVAMFGSASTKEKSYIDATFDLAKKVGQRGWRMSTGAGDLGCMGSMDKGFDEGRREFNIRYPNAPFKPAHVGVSTQNILQIEGYPKGVDQLIITNDIYNRIHIMLRGNKSQNKMLRAKDATKVVFVVPGGTGTLHEFAAMMQMALNTKDMEEKTIVLLNVPNHLDSRKDFWDKLIETAKKLGFADHFKVANSPEEAIAIADREYQKWLERHPEHKNLPHPVLNPGKG
jgi:predicted Rossmann-fold nucleotide-binding protein